VVIAARSRTRYAVNATLGVLVGLVAIAWAWAPSIIALATDGIPAEEYEGYNTSGYVLLALMLTVVLPLVSVAVYATTLMAGRPARTALIRSQMPCSLVAAAAFALLSRS
jgi:hypothetical protein